ncbi:MAG: hypothetical protein JWO78_683 [Micavibrio sp.]|nr:hypothetical protein [Micavibrio sp.]
MVLAEDSAPNVSTATKAANLKQFFYADGKPVFADKALFQKAIGMTYPNVRDEILQKKLIIITDDNMATEFKKSGHHP